MSERHYKLIRGMTYQELMDNDVPEAHAIDYLKMSGPAYVVEINPETGEERRVTLGTGIALTWQASEEFTVCQRA